MKSSTLIKWDFKLARKAMLYLSLMEKMGYRRAGETKTGNKTFWNYNCKNVRTID